MTIRRQNDWLVLIAVIGIIAIAVTSCGAAEPKGPLVTETYFVKPGDTLWAIAEQYIQKNTDGPRDTGEFYHGIIELNYDLLKDRPPGLILEGDKLQINYWVTEKTAP